MPQKRIATALPITVKAGITIYPHKRPVPIARTMERRRTNGIKTGVGDRGSALGYGDIHAGENYMGSRQNHAFCTGGEHGGPCSCFSRHLSGAECVRAGGMGTLHTIPCMGMGNLVYSLGMEETTIVPESGAGALPPVADPELEAMMKAGVHLGHAKTKDHPSMKRYLFGVRNTISIIDLLQTKEHLAKAKQFLAGIAERGGLVLLVGTRPAARKLILDVAQKTGMPYFTERWIGGTLTNGKVIAKRVEHMMQLEQDKKTGALEKYTKKERLVKDEELARLTRMFDGLRTLKRMPDAVFIVDTTYDDTAVNEARKMKVPVVALCDTNANAAVINHPIPSNDDALPAVRYMIGEIGEAIEYGLRERQRTAAAAPVEKQAA